MLKWLKSKILYIELGSTLKNGDIDSFDRKMRDELPNREFIITLKEADILIEQWCKGYNQIQPYTLLISASSS